ncbi:MAG: hypothetical protein PW792_08620 [Acidobacteriaceae bacterium]|nr:hypothetical protein [Acidobacteriaceae bacterium]
MAESPGSSNSSGTPALVVPVGSWPAPLAHCESPLIKFSDDRVLIGEITSEEQNGYKGNRLFYTAMIPVSELPTVLQVQGGLHHKVSSDSSNTSLGADDSKVFQFWIQSPAGPRYESLLAVWDNSKQTVLQIHPEFLAAYRLVPRNLANGMVCWDDLSRPVYDVVRVESVSTYTSDGYSTARVTVLKDYLEDFLHQRSCAAVAVFFDERFSTDDTSVAEIIAKHGWHTVQAARQFWFKDIDLDFANQISQVSCTELLLDPHSSPISEPVEESLFWPGRTAPIHGKGKGAFAPMELAYVRDEVLAEFEQQPGYDTSPEGGWVGYGNHWAVSFVDRIGRNHLAIELRKLYEGAPFNVIKHYHAYAVVADVAIADRGQHGNRNIGVRAKELVYAFMAVNQTLAQIAENLGLVFTPTDLGQLGLEEINYCGWWTNPELKALGYTALEKMPLSELLSRTKDIFNLLQRWQKAPLLQIAVSLGVKKNDIANFQSLKLIATVCQLAQIAKDSGLNLVADRQLIAPSWDSKVELGVLTPIFKLNGLRIMEAHSLAGGISNQLIEALALFGIDPQQHMQGWGLALDMIFDRTIDSLRKINTLFKLVLDTNA